MYLSGGTEVPGSWLNALNVKHPASLPYREDQGKEKSRDNSIDRPTIHERLENIGTPFKKNHVIRIAPIKGSNIDNNFLESKIKIVEK